MLASSAASATSPTWQKNQSKRRRSERHEPVGMNAIEKILANHSEQDEVPGATAGMTS